MYRRHRCACCVEGGSEWLDRLCLFQVSRGFTQVTSCRGESALFFFFFSCHFVLKMPLILGFRDGDGEGSASGLPTDSISHLIVI